MLLDTGPVVALIDRDESAHQACLNVLDATTFPLLTTWAVITEAMHLLGRRRGHPAQQAIWRLLRQGIFECVDPSDATGARAEALMAKYADVPMDFVDATLVALAENRNEARIFTLDSDFQVYRLHGRRRFHIVPTIS